MMTIGDANYAGQRVTYTLENITHHLSVRMCLKLTIEGITGIIQNSLSYITYV